MLAQYLWRLMKNGDLSGSILTWNVVRNCRPNPKLSIEVGFSTASPSLGPQGGGLDTTVSSLGLDTWIWLISDGLVPFLWLGTMKCVLLLVKWKGGYVSFIKFYRKFLTQPSKMILGRIINSIL